MNANVPYDVYKWLGKNRGEVSSWAVWENPPATLDPRAGLTTEGVGAVDFFLVDGPDEYLDGIGQALRRDVVLIGLNPAGREDEFGEAKRDQRLFGSFHDDHPKQVKDHRLRAIAYHWGLWGAFVVDLDPITVETSSKAAFENLVGDPEHRGRCADLLSEALRHLAPPKDCQFVFLGGAVARCGRTSEFQDVFRTFSSKERRVIWHYSHQARLEERMRNAKENLDERQDPSALWVPRSNGKTTA